MKIRAASFLLFLLVASCAGIPEPFSIPKVYLNNGDLMMDIHKEANAVSALSVSQNGRYLLTVDNGGTWNATDLGIVRMWNLVEGRQVFKGTNTLKLAMAAAISPDGRYAVTGGETRGTVKEAHDQYALNVWDLTAGTIVKKFEGFKGPWLYVYDVKFSLDGRYFLASSLNETYVFDTRDWNAIRKFPAKGCVAAGFSPDGKCILAGDKDGFLHLWEIATSKEIWRIHGHKSCLLGEGANSITFSPDGRSVVTSSRCDDVVRVWDALSGKALKQFAGFEVVQGRRDGWSGVNGIALSPDGTQALIFAKPLKTWDLKTGKELVDFSGAWKGLAIYTGNTLSGAYHPDGRRVLLNLSDSAVRMYDASTGEEMAMFVGFADGEWLTITKEGYYNSSEKGAQYLSIVVGDRTYGVDKFYDVFYRPDIVAAKLRGEDIRGLVTITMSDAIQSPPPVVEITSQLSQTDQPKVKISYRVKSTGGGIGEIRLFHNGKLIQSDGYYKEIARSPSNQMQLAAINSRTIYEDMRGISAVREKLASAPTASKSKGEFFEGVWEVEAIPGENEISVAAFNSSNTVQSYMKTVKFHSSLKPEEPHLYILAIGIDQYRDANVNLKYAVKDARDIEEKIKVQAATLYNPRNIHYELLTDREATKANITGKVEALAKAVKPQDSLILFVAGHGVLLQNQYYLLTHDYNGNISEDSVISSNEIVDMSKKMKSLSQLFIFDTCHAGGVDTIISGLYDARMSVLAKKMGLHIYASASARQAAMDGYKGNGLFTYTLLDGLNNNRQADKNKDGKVSIVGLGEYSRKMTWNISKQIGHEQTPLIINFGKDSPIYRLQ
ncbi:MAG: caspase family protein [Deltaproteobacteria bacterium]|nr:caspase family protein [Deltaproteobacteria bacterium]